MFFPQYRKLSNHKSFYKIVSKDTFEEIQLVGTVSMKIQTTATKYPEILRIKEMLDGAVPFEMSTEAEFNSHE
tara:strand:+ start:578 stop:796 length:219 start_codon:yes stop_codon:yes gene_type:complete